MQSVSLAIGQTVSVQAIPLDAGGNQGASITGVPSWNSTNPAIASVGSVSADGLSSIVTAVAAGTTTIQDAGNSSAGNFSTPFTVVVTGGPAVSFLYVFGTPS